MISKTLATRTVVSVLFALAGITLGQTANNSKPATVQGRVIYSDTHNPVRRADVTLVPLESTDKPDTATSDRSGEFIFDAVAPGRYLAVAGAPNLIDPFFAADGETGLKETWRSGAIPEGCTEVTVGAAGSVKVDIVAQRGGAITGEVRDSLGEPIPRAEVKLFLIRDGNAIAFKPISDYETSRLGFNLTDDQGVYRLGGLPSGQYLVRVSDSKAHIADLDREPGRQSTASFLTAYFPAARSVEDAQPVKVIAGEDTAGINITLSDRQTCTVSGRVVVHSTNDPIIDAFLELDRVGEPTPAFSWSMGAGAGNWSVVGLPDGKYILTADSPYQTNVKNSDGSTRHISVLPARTEFTVKGADLNEIVVSVEPASSISGKVHVSGPGAKDRLLSLEAIRQPDGDAGQTLVGPERPSPAQTLEDADGTFIFQRLGRGKYLLRLAPSDRIRGFITTAKMNDKDILYAPIELGNGQAITGVDFSISTEVASIKGTVQNARKESVADAVVAFMPTDANQRRMLNGPVVQRADAAGRFTLSVPPGEYFVVAMSPSSVFELNDAFWRDRGPALTRVKFRAGEHLDNLLVHTQTEQPK